MLYAGGEGRLLYKKGMKKRWNYERTEGSGKLMGK
jgi:hypothetical protein